MLDASENKNKQQVINSEEGLEINSSQVDHEDVGTQMMVSKANLAIGSQHGIMSSPKTVNENDLQQQQTSSKKNIQQLDSEENMLK